MKLLPSAARFVFSIVLLVGAVLGLSAAEPHVALDEKIAALSKITLTSDLLDQVEKTARMIVKASNDDPGFRAEMAAVNKDRRVDQLAVAGDASSATTYLEAKYPKVVALAKASGMTPGDALLAINAFTTAALAADLDWPAPDDKTIAANIAFAKANKARIEALFKP